VSALVVRPAGFFAQGDIVGAYPYPANPPTGAKISGSPAETSTLEPDGSLTFTTLDPGRYLLAKASDLTRWIAAVHSPVEVADEQLTDEQTARIAGDASEGLVALPETSRIVVRNDYARAPINDLTGVTAAYNAGSTGTATNLITTDTDLGANCVELNATHAGAFTDIAKIGDPVGTYGPLTANPQICFGRATVKILTAPGPVDVNLVMYFSNAGETVTRRRVIDRREHCVAGAIVLLEGFDLAPANVTNVRLEIEFNGTTAGAYTYRWGKPQIVVDPDSDVPVFGHGFYDGWTWTGTAGQSASWGYSPPSHVEKWGYQDYVLFTPESTAPDRLAMNDTPARLAERLVDAGATHFRCGIDPTTAWPTAGDGPDWTRTVYGQMCEEFKKHGIKWIPCIGNFPAWGSTTNPQAPTGPNSLRLSSARYADLVKLYVTLVEEYPEVIEAVEYVNEPNLQWVDALGTIPPEPAYLAARMAEMYDGIKGARPEITFLGPGLSRNYLSDGQQMSVYDYLTGMYAAGAKGKMDAVSIHPYPPVSAGSVQGSPQANSFDAAPWNALAAVRQVAREQSDSLPIWVTEVGLPDSRNVAPLERHQMQTNLLMRGILTRQGIQCVIIHCLNSSPTQSADAQSFAVISRQSGRKKLAHRALRRGRSGGADWIPLTLQNSWVALGGNYQIPAYRVHDDGRVELRGAVTGGSSAGATIATLPEGVRPSRQFNQPADGNLAYASLFIRTDGQINCQAGGSTAFTSLDGVSFNPQQ
jgi:hypothetical protein